jgi:hypothetical protein
MATVGGTVLTITDFAQRLDPDGSVPDIAELLNEKNEVLTDMLWVEGNLPTGMRTTQRTGLPNVTFRLLNTGVQASKSTVGQIDDACAILEGWSVIDEKIAKLNGNLEALRLSEAKPFLEAMNQQFVSTLFYGNIFANPGTFLGFSPRYGAISGAVNQQNILNLAGTGSTNASIWLIGWGEDTVCGIFPKASTAGLSHEDYGLQTVQAQVAGGAVGMQSGFMRAYQDRFVWEPGLALRDWRYAVRIANIGVPALVSAGVSSTIDLIAAMSRSLDRPPSLKGANLAFYMNRTLYSFLRLQGLNYSKNAVTVQPALNQFEMGFEGVPIRRVDQLLNTEAQIT